jgi:hypothetical protein
VVVCVPRLTPLPFFFFCSRSRILTVGYSFTSALTTTFTATISITSCCFSFSCAYADVRCFRDGKRCGLSFPFFGFFFFLTVIIFSLLVVVAGPLALPPCSVAMQERFAIYVTLTPFARLYFNDLCVISSPLPLSLPPGARGKVAERSGEQREGCERLPERESSGVQCRVRTSACVRVCVCCSSCCCSLLSKDACCTTMEVIHAHLRATHQPSLFFLLLFCTLPLQ